jgi:microcystin-dependent protein
MAEPFLSEIRIVSFGFAPRGWALCNGQLLPINQNQALFALLGTTFGGDGRLNFALPDMRGRTPVHPDAGVLLGERSGTTTHTLSLAEMPGHDHALRASSDLAASTSAAGNVLGKKGRFGKDIYVPAATGNTVALRSDAVSSVGGVQPHTNMQPYLALNFVIALQGIFPSQN